MKYQILRIVVAGSLLWILYAALTAAPPEHQSGEATQATRGTESARTGDAPTGEADPPNAPQILHVLDARTGEHLRDVDVYCAPWPPPGAPASHAKSLPSPIEIPAQEQLVQTLQIGAPGYAWRQFDLQFQSPQTWTIELQPAGTLEIRWEGKFGAPGRSSIEIRPVLPSFVSLDDLGGLGPAVFRANLSEGAEETTPSIHVDRLPPGRHAVRVLARETFPMFPAHTGSSASGTPSAPAHFEPAFSPAEADARVLAAGLVSITHDAHHTITLDARANQLHSPQLSLRGKVTVPPTWTATKPTAICFDPPQGIGPPLATTRFFESYPVDGVVVTGFQASGPNQWEWRASDSFHAAHPGRYRVSIEPYGWVALLELTDPGEERALDFVLGEPATVQVRAVDAMGRTLDLRAIRWERTPPDAERRFRARPSAVQAQLGTAVFQCAPQRISVTCEVAGYTSKHDQTFQVVAGSNQVEVVMAKHTPFTVRCFAGDERMRLRSDYDLRFSLETDSGRSVHARDEGGRLAAPGPGRYRIIWHDLDGFVAPAPSVVDIAADGGTVIDVEYARL